MDERSEEEETQIWTGQIKHRLKTPTGATLIAELFHIDAQIPAKLMEQIPPTIFINVIVGKLTVTTPPRIHWFVEQHQT